MRNETKQRVALIVALVICDALAVSGALLLAYYLRIVSGLLPYTSPYTAGIYWRITLIAIPVWLLILAGHQLYRFDNLLGGPEEYAQVFKACSFGIISLVILSFFQRGQDLSRGWLLLAWGLSLLAVGSTRFLLRRGAFLMRRHRGWFISRALVVGANEQAKAIARQLQPAASSGIQVIGFVDDFLPIGTPIFGQLRVLGSPRALPALTQRYEVTELLVIPQATAWESFQEIMLADGNAYHGVRIRISPGFYELLTTGVRVDHKAFVPLLTPEKNRITGIDALLKIGFDVILVLGGAILWAPVLGLLTLLKRLATPGAVFRQEPVLGQGGASFTARTFAVNAADTTDGFGRRLDRFLRRTGLYRLPNVPLVLSGRMSLVGPRPIPLHANPGVPEWLPNLLTVKPGITGPWIMASTTDGVPEEERRLDTFYVRNWTIWLDFQILFRTVFVVLRAERGEA